MAFTQKITWETMRTLDTSTLSGSYAKVGTPITNPSIKLKMVNNSNVLVTVSIDGSTDIDVLPAGTFFLYDEFITGIPSTQFLPAKTQIYVKGSSGTGLIYLVTQYIIVG